MNKIFLNILLFIAVASLFLISCNEDTIDVNRFGTISGTIYERDIDKPLFGAIVYTTPPSSSVITDSAGAFTINKVLIGEYSVTATKEGFRTKSINAAVFESQVTQAIMTLQKAEEDQENLLKGSISGKVLSTPGNTPVVGASITTDPPTSAVITGENGSFEIADIVRGVYKVIARKGGYLSDTVSIEVKKDMTTEAVLLLEVKGSFGSIQGVVLKSPDNSPLSGVSITTDPSTTAIISDNQGKFSLNDVPVGDYAVIAKKGGYEKDSVGVKVDANEVNSITILLVAK